MQRIRNRPRIDQPGDVLYPSLGLEGFASKCASHFRNIEKQYSILSVKSLENGKPDSLEYGTFTRYKAVVESKQAIEANQARNAVREIRRFQNPSFEAWCNPVNRSCATRNEIGRISVNFSPKQQQLSVILQILKKMSWMIRDLCK